jgi:hypothetical protein
MAVRKLDKAEWPAVFTLISKNLAGSRTEIEVDSLNLGSQIEAEWLPLVGITYDHKDDVIDVALDGSDKLIDHLIRQPREVFIDETPTELASLEIIDGDGARQIILLREPLLLPPPEQHTG